MPVDPMLTPSRERPHRHEQRRVFPVAGPGHGLDGLTHRDGGLVAPRDLRHHLAGLFEIVDFSEHGPSFTGRIRRVEVAISCPEAGTDPRRRALLAQATETDTIVTDSVSGRSARTVRSRYSEAMEATREPLPAFLQMYGLTDPLLDAGQDDIASFHLYGQAARLNRAIPAADLFRLLVAETEAAFTRVSTR